MPRYKRFIPLLIPVEGSESASIFASLMAERLRNKQKRAPKPSSS
jgi:hypothetical protein